MAIARAQSQRGFDALESVLGMAEEHPPVTRRGVSVGVVRVLGNGGLGFGDRRPHLSLRIKDVALLDKGRRIVRLKYQRAIDRFFGARDVARSLVAPIHVHAPSQSLTEANHRGHALWVESKRALEQRCGVPQGRLAS